MANAFDIKILGSKKLQRKLNSLDRATAGRAMRASMKEAMQPVLKLAKRRAPVETGRLQRSIRIASFRGRRGSGLVGSVVRTGTRKQLKIPADAKFYYPAAHEYGTSKIPAKSFLRSSLADKKSQVLNNVRDEVKKNIKKAIRR